MSFCTTTMRLRCDIADATDRDGVEENSKEHVAVGGSTIVLEKGAAMLGDKNLKTRTQGVGRDVLAGIEGVVRLHFSEATHDELLGGGEGVGQQRDSLTQTSHVELELERLERVGEDAGAREGPGRVRLQELRR